MLQWCLPYKGQYCEKINFYTKIMEGLISGWFFGRNTKSYLYPWGSFTTWGGGTFKKRSTLIFEN